MATQSPPLVVFVRCPECRTLFDTRPGLTAACPTCGERFRVQANLADGSQGSVEGLETVLPSGERRRAERAPEKPQRKTQPNWREVPDSGLHLGDAVCACLLGMAGAALLAIGLSLRNEVLSYAGAVFVFLFLLSGFISIGWTKYQSLSGTQYFWVRLPRNIVLAVLVIVSLGW